MSYLLKYSVVKIIRLKSDLGSGSDTNFGQIS